MRESINSVPLFNIVIVFVFLFTGYVSLSINLSKAYNVKNEIFLYNTCNNFLYMI